MPRLEDCDHLFAPELRELWPLAGLLARTVTGRLMGGTALALHLKHRASEDIDIMTFKDFSGAAMSRRMNRHISEAYPDGRIYGQDVLTAEKNGYYAIIGDVKVDVFQAKPTEGSTAKQMRWLEKPANVDGVPVGALPDILASKLDVIMYRPKLRDYIDLAAIDQHSEYSLEDGIDFYRRKYGYMGNPNSHVLRRIVSMLEDPGIVHADDRFEAQRNDVFDHLESRAHELNDYLTDTVDKEIQKISADAAAEIGDSRPQATNSKRCGKWMPIARTYCVLTPKHAGGCRSSC